MQIFLEKAKKLAKEAHKNQLYNKNPYYDSHLIRVAVTAKEIAYKEGIVDPEIINLIEIVSYLHDYLEDTIDYSLTTIKSEYIKLSEKFNVGIASAVLVLSRNVYKNDSEYFEAISENLITKIVKAADRISNILLLEEINDEEKRITLYQKYKNQLIYFNQFDIYPSLIIKALSEY